MINIQKHTLEFNSICLLSQAQRVRLLVDTFEKHNFTICNARFMHSHSPTIDDNACIAENRKIMGKAIQVSEHKCVGFDIFIYLFIYQ